MKKFLSLVLSLVMAMSLVTVSAGAKDDTKGFTDASDINYNEAVDVMSGIGIISGYRDDSFRPDGALTRGAAAKIISYLNLGTKTADVLSCTSAPYKDVKPSDTFAPYIAYVKNAKICDGYSDGTFRAGAPLTGFAFNKMLLTSLGYSSEVEEFTGANWSVAVAKLAVKIGLTDGNDDFTGLDTCTREEACLYALNTLQATEVEYDNEGSVITTGDIKIVNKASAAEKVTTNNKDGKNIDAEKNNDGEYYLEFAEDHFDDLELKDNDRDDFGAPSNTWTYKDKDIGTYATDADFEFTTTADGDTIKEKLEDMDLDEYTMKDHVDLWENGKVDDDFFDNDNDDEEELKNLNGKGEAGKQLVDQLGKGRLVKVYTDDQAIEDVIVIDTYLAEITSISSASDKVTLDVKENDDTFTVKVDDDNDYYAELSDMDEDDYVLVTLADKEVKSVAIPETETGTISRISKSDGDCDGLTFDGTKYKLSKTASDFTTEMEIKADDDSTLYIDTYGFAIWIDDVAENNDYIVVIKNYQSIDDDEIVDSVRGYDMEGNKVDLKDVDVKNSNGDPVEGTVYNYESDDGQYILDAGDDRIDDDTSFAMEASTVKIGTHYFDNDAKFIFLGKDSKDNDFDMNDVTVEEEPQKVEAAIQYIMDDEKNVSDSEQKIIAVVIDAESDNATGDDVAYISEVTGSEKVDDDDADVYTLYIEGDEVEDVISEDTGLDENTFVTYAKNDDGTYDLDAYDVDDNYEDDTAVVLEAEVEAVPTEKVMSLMERTPFGGDDLDDLNCKDAVVIDLTDDEDIGNMSDLQDEKEAHNDIEVSVVFNGDEDDDDYKTVSYIFVTKNEDNGSSGGSSHSGSDHSVKTDGTVTYINEDSGKTNVDREHRDVAIDDTEYEISLGAMEFFNRYVEKNDKISIETNKAGQVAKVTVYDGNITVTDDEAFEDMVIGGELIVDDGKFEANKITVKGEVLIDSDDTATFEDVEFEDNVTVDSKATFKNVEFKEDLDVNDEAVFIDSVDVDGTITGAAGINVDDADKATKELVENADGEHKASVDATLKTLKVDDKEVADFDAKKLSYTITLDYDATTDDIGTVTAEANNKNATIAKIIQATKFNVAVEVKVTAADEDTINTYTVTFVKADKSAEVYVEEAETLVDGDLSTQKLVDAAKVAYEDASEAVSNMKHGEARVNLELRLKGVNDAIDVAQGIIDDAKAAQEVEALEKATDAFNKVKATVSEITAEVGKTFKIGEKEFKVVANETTADAVAEGTAFATVTEATALKDACDVSLEGQNSSKVTELTEALQSAIAKVTAEDHVGTLKA